MTVSRSMANNNDVTVAQRFNDQVPHSKDLGMEVIAVGTDRVHMRLAPQPWFLSDDSAEEVCSSVLYSLADSAAGLAVFAVTRELSPIATLDLHMDYLRPADISRNLFTTACCRHLSDEVAFIYCEIFSEGEEQPVATGSATFMRNTPGKRFKAVNTQEAGS